jgi:hypothetical protein
VSGRASNQTIYPSFGRIALGQFERTWLRPSMAGLPPTAETVADCRDRRSGQERSLDSCKGFSPFTERSAFVVCSYGPVGAVLIPGPVS